MRVSAVMLGSLRRQCVFVIVREATLSVATGLSACLVYEVMESVSLRAVVGVIMGSKSDFETMRHATDILREFGVSFETEIVSAHRTPDKLYQYARTARERGLQVIVAGAGGAAHLPGMTAALTTVPVIGVPVESKALHWLDSLLSIVQMPAGIPVAAVAIGVAGAKNAGLLAVSILAATNAQLAQQLEMFRGRQTQTVLDTELFDSGEEETER